MKTIPILNPLTVIPDGSALLRERSGTQETGRNAAVRDPGRPYRSPGSRIVAPLRCATVRDDGRWSVRREVFFTLALTTGMLAAVPAFAQTADPVVVTATKILTPISRIGSAVAVITAAEIDAHQWRTLPDALATTPGLSLVQSGGPGGLTSVFIRGANAGHAKVLIDGIEVNDPSTPNAGFDFGQVLTADLARIEVLRGPQSSLYGSDALGGVINIVSAEGKGAAKIRASLEGGSFKTFNQTLGVSGSTAQIRYAFDFAHFRSGDTPVTPLDLLVPGEKRIGDRYDNVTAATKLGLDVSKEVSLGFVLRYTDAHLRSTGENFSNFSDNFPDAAQTDQKTRQLFTRVEARVTLFNGVLQNVIGVGFADYRTRIQPPDDGFGLPAATVDNGDRLKFDWQGTVKLSATQTLLLGAETLNDRLLGSPINASDRAAAGFAEWQASPLAHLSFAASVRYDSDARFGGKTTWRIAPVYTLPATKTVIRASVGTGFKAPTLNQLFVSYPEFFFFANPNLKAETSIGYDVGVEQPLAHDRFRLGATWFHNAIRNLIDTNASFDSYANVGRATTYGIESFAAVSVSDRLSVRADYTWTVARDDIKQQDLLHRPRHKADLTATWRPNAKLTLSATALYLGTRIDGNRDFSITRLTASAYGTVNLSGSYGLGHGVTLFGRIDNALDRHYQNPTGFDRPGLGAFAGVRFN